jgi:hypothetical protein
MDIEKLKEKLDKFFDSKKMSIEQRYFLAKYLEEEYFAELADNEFEEPQTKATKKKRKPKDELFEDFEEEGEDEQQEDEDFEEEATEEEPEEDLEDLDVPPTRPGPPKGIIKKPRVAVRR